MKLENTILFDKAIELGISKYNIRKSTCALCGKEVIYDIDTIEDLLVYDRKLWCGTCELPEPSEYYD